MNANDSKQKRVWCIVRVRLIGLVSLICFLVVLASWVFLFSEPAWKVFIVISLASLSFSWLASVLGYWLLIRHPEGEPTSRVSNPGTMASLAQYALFLGIFGFVVFFVVNAS
jgi:hypothetical protein